MQEELTDEMLKRMNIRSFSVFESFGACTIYDEYKSLIHALQAERAKPKVWDGAPDDCAVASVRYVTNGFATYCWSQNYTRELPKTREREIAEECAKSWKQSDGKTLEDNIEAALLKLEAELKEQEK